MSYMKLIIHGKTYRRVECGELRRETDIYWSWTYSKYMKTMFPGAEMSAQSSPHWREATKEDANKWYTTPGVMREALTHDKHFRTAEMRREETLQELSSQDLAMEAAEKENEHARMMKFFMGPR